MLRGNQGEIGLSDYRGQVVMLSFWATWCPPCRAEMPAIQAVYNQYRDQGFEVLAINHSENRETIVPFVSEEGVNFPIVLDPNGHLQRDYRTETTLPVFSLLQMVKYWQRTPVSLQANRLWGMLKSVLRNSKRYVLTLSSFLNIQASHSNIMARQSQSSWFCLSCFAFATTSL